MLNFTHNTRIVIFWFSTLCCLPGIAFGNNDLDSLKGILKLVDRSSLRNKDSVRLQLFNLITSQYIAEGDSKQALTYSDSVLSYKLGTAIPNWYKKIQCTAYRNRGEIFFNDGNLTAALENCKHYLECSKQLGDSMNIATAYNAIGAVYNDFGKYPEALENFYAALRINKKLKLQRIVAMNYLNIGLIFQEQGTTKSALQNYDSTLAIMIRIKDKEGMVAAYNQIGVTYMNQQQYDQALEYLNRAQKTSLSSSKKPFLGTVIHNIGDVYFHQNNYNYALKHYLDALEIFETTDPTGALDSYLGIGKVHFKLKHYVRSEINFRKGMKLSKDYGFRKYTASYLLALSDLHYAEGKNKEALIEYKQYVVLKDSLDNETTAQKIALLQANYTIEQNELENKLLKDEFLIQSKVIALEKKQKRILLASIIVIPLILGSIFVIYYKRYKTKQQIRLLNEINIQKGLRYNAILEAEEKERRRIALEIHDGIGQGLSAIKLNVSMYQKEGPDGDRTLLNNALSIINETIDDVRAISHNLMPSTLIRLGLKKSVKELTDKINHAGVIQVAFKTNLNTKLSETVETALYRIIQETLTNIVKHSGATSASITLFESGDKLNLEISDNGKHFEPSKLPSGKGIGWSNILTRVDLVGGTISINGSKSDGTKIIISITNKAAKNEHQ